jgi:hypothetical protein
MRKWEWGRYTVSQLMVLLDTSDPNDPHAGNIPISSLDEIDELFG